MRFPTRNLSEQEQESSTLLQFEYTFIIDPYSCNCTFSFMPPFALVMHCISVKEFPGFDGAVLDNDRTYVAVVPEEIVVAALWIDGFAGGVDSLDCAHPLLPHRCSA